MMFRTTILFLLAATASSVPAQEATFDEEMEALRTACKPDIERLCPEVEPGAGRIEECLTQHQEEMSESCAQALQKLHDGSRHCPREA